jgi:hypothetical protein
MFVKTQWDPRESISQDRRGHGFVVMGERRRDTDQRTTTDWLRFETTHCTARYPSAWVLPCHPTIPSVTVSARNQTSRHVTPSVVPSVDSLRVYERRMRVGRLGGWAVGQIGALASKHGRCPRLAIRRPHCPTPFPLPAQSSALSVFHRHSYQILPRSSRLVRSESARSERHAKLGKGLT